jgi:hypothetical protein
MLKWAWGRGGSLVPAVYGEAVETVADQRRVGGCVAAVGRRRVHTLPCSKRDQVNSDVRRE